MVSHILLLLSQFDHGKLTESQLSEKLAYYVLEVSLIQSFGF